MAARVMENEYLKVTVDDFGAELCSVWDKELEQERIWTADPAVWNRHAPLLFPFIGKVNGGVYRHQGVVYEAKTQHGFARDLEFTCVSAEKDAVTHCLKSNEETLKRYPFSFELYVTHRFSGDNGRLLEVRWELKNPGSEDMYYSLGAHPGFPVPEREEGSRDDYFLEFPGKEALQYILINPENAMAVPDKEYTLKLSEGRVRIAADMFDKDALIFEKGQVEEVKIVRADFTPYVSMYCAGFPYMGIWSKPDGKYVCLEPWYGRSDDDGFNGELKDKAGEQMLPAGEMKAIVYGMEFHK